jgi:CheY-like chemotaxis protein
MARLFDEFRNWLRPTDSGEDITLAPAAPDHLGSATPRAFVVDDEDGICQLIMMTLATMGVGAKKFHTAQDAVAALDHELPAIIFLDVALQKSDAIDVIRGLGERGYGGVVQLMSGSNVDLLEDVRRVGARHGLNMRPPLSKPVAPTRSVRSSPARISPRVRSPSSDSTKRSPGDGSSCGISRKSICAATRSWAPRGSSAAAIRSTGFCRRRASCRARAKAAMRRSPSM